jgi:hypothetical protein
MNLESLSAKSPQKHVQARAYPAPRPSSFASEAIPAGIAPVPANIPDIPFAEDSSSSGEEDGGITSAFGFGSSNKSTPTESKVFYGALYMLSNSTNKVVLTVFNLQIFRMPDLLHYD